MFNKLLFVMNSEQTYDLHIYYDNKSEFSKEFYPKDLKENKELKVTLKKKIIRTIKIFVGGSLIILIPYQLLTTEQKNIFIDNIESENNSNINENIFIEENQFNLGYLFFGTVDEQINYVIKSKTNITSPSYFNITSTGNLELNYPNKRFINTMHDNNIKVIPFLSNHWDRNSGISALNNIDKLSSDIASAIEEYNLDGINIDLENLTSNEKEKYVNLIKVLREKIPKDKEISVAVAANPYNYKTGWHGSYDYENLAKYSDYLIIMSYDEHYDGGSSGPICSIDFFEKSIKYALTKTTKDKIVMGYALYGRIWSTTNTNIKGLALTNSMITKIKENYTTTYTIDKQTQSAKLEFEVKNNDKKITINNTTLQTGKYVIWYEDTNSINEKNLLLNQYKLKGKAFWALGQEDTSIWNNF